jgi:zinc protease
MRRALLFAICATLAHATETVTLPGKSPIVTFRIVFRTGAASDPADKPGLANLTCELLSGGGTKDMTYKQVVDALFPMASNISSYTDKEMMTFTGETHVDNLDKYYAIFRDVLLNPGFRDDDFQRVKDDALNALKVNLRGNNDEELAKEELYNLLYPGHPYGHENLGTIAALEKMTLDDVKQFYRTHLTRDRLTIGLAGGYPKDFLARVQKDFDALPEKGAAQPAIPAPAAIDATRLTIIQKDTRSVAYSLGFPIDVKRGDPDYPALLVMQSYFGQHRSSGVLYNTMRELRGLNYGDYDYIEYFPRGMFQFEPDPNIARTRQIFQIWIRPVEPPSGVFALRIAMYQLDRLVRDGISADDFERVRSFVSKYVNLLTKTKSAELGYAIDSRFYGIPGYNAYVKDALAKLTREDVNRAIRKHLRADRIQIVAVAKDAEGLRAKLLSGEPSPMSYNAPKSDTIVAEDKVIEKWNLKLSPDGARIVPVASVFQ